MNRNRNYIEKNVRKRTRMNIVKRLGRKPESILNEGYEEEHEWILKKMSRMRKRINIEKCLGRGLGSILKKLGKEIESILKKC